MTQTNHHPLDFLAPVVRRLPSVLRIVERLDLPLLAPLKIRLAHEGAAGSQSNPQNDYIAQVVRDQTFADVGGLWGTLNERVSVAAAHGARELTMCDIAPLDSPMWADFDAHLQKRGLQGVKRLSGDIQKLAELESPPQFDVIHCSGVLYHLPNPLQLFIALRKLTKRHLILSSSVIPQKIQNLAGTLEIPEGAALFIPGLSEREMAIVRAYLEPHVKDGAVGITRPVSVWDPTDFVPWWWLPTPSCLRRMGEATGFRCLAHAPSWGGLAHTLLLEVR